MLFREQLGVLFAPFAFVLQRFRRWHLRHRLLMAQAILADLKGERHTEDGAAMLYGEHAAGVEAPAVADAFDLVQDRHRRIAGTQEVAVQRMGRPVFRNGT